MHISRYIYTSPQFVVIPRTADARGRGRPMKCLRMRNTIIYAATTYTLYVYTGILSCPFLGKEYNLSTAYHASFELAYQTRYDRLVVTIFIVSLEKRLKCRGV